MKMRMTDEIRAENREIAAEIKEQLPWLYEELGKLARFGGNIIDAAVLERKGKVDRPGFAVQLFTEQHGYTITMIRRDLVKGDDGYLGATTSTRKPVAGENWARGSDLADGPCDIETWQRITTDIIAHELVRLGK